MSISIVEKCSKFKSTRTFYAIFKSRKNLKRKSWYHSTSVSTEKELIEFFTRLNDPFREYHKDYDYKIVVRTVETKDVCIDPKKLMLMRIEHGF